KWFGAAAILLLPVIALTVTELAGVTHLFRQQAKPEPSKPGDDPTPVADGKKETPPAVAPFTDAEVQRIAALPAEQQVEEVRKELMRRNPNFDGKVEYRVEAGVVTELKFSTLQVRDISPVRALADLRKLAIGNYPNGKSSLADLSP